MNGELPPVEIKKPSNNLRSFAIEFLVAINKRPPNPEHFNDIEPIIEETLIELKREREVGNIVGSSENPCGNPKQLNIIFGSDFHNPGGKPDTASDMHTRLAILDKLGKTSQKWPKDLWRKELRPTWHIIGYRAFLEGVIKKVQSKKISGPLLFEDGGDRVSTENTKSDTAFWALELSIFRKILEKYVDDSGDISNLQRLQNNLAQRVNLLKAKKAAEGLGEDKPVELSEEEIESLNRNQAGNRVYASAVMGNYEGNDPDKALYAEEFERQLFGSQIFLQEVGMDRVVLQLNSNFYDRYWYDYYAKLKGKPENKKAVDILEREYALQENLIKKAKESGKKIVLICHDEDSVRTRLKYNKMNITHVIAGHKHKPEDKELVTKNVYGESIRSLTTGTALQGRPGAETVMAPVGYYISITDENVEVEKIEGIFNDSALNLI